ncbi:hypothetical protein PR001_g16451 [Phytophthora rubi]|uniref:Uncharacterized protein n=1 Tax=Phytophthora rubi TaxID=129364 RepID=A0A6A3KUZ2_9STRA|nr:hypothetical protein PR001_g16451 [Phytophthora rubi]
MRKAFEGASAVATISEWLIGDRRYKQIKNALDVAKQMDLVHFCYTSGAGEVNYVRTCSMGSNNDESIDKSSSSNGDWSSIDRKRRPT